MTGLDSASWEARNSLYFAENSELGCRAGSGLLALAGSSRTLCFLPAVLGCDDGLGDDYDLDDCYYDLNDCYFDCDDFGRRWTRGRVNFRDQGRFASCASAGTCSQDVPACGSLSAGPLLR